MYVAGAFVAGVVVEQLVGVAAAAVAGEAEQLWEVAGVSAWRFYFVHFHLRETAALQK